MRIKLPEIFRGCLLALAFCLCVNSAHAQTAADYSASVAVADQSDGARNQALRDALVIVIGRVSGDPSAASGRAAPLLAQATSLVQQYSYQPDDKGQLQLLASFDQRGLDSAVRSLGLPVWGIAAAAVDTVVLSLSGVTTPRQYARLITYLSSQPGVKNLAVNEIAGTTLSLSLRAEGGAQRLLGAVGVGNVLKPLSGSTGALNFAMTN
ncbi:MAG: DUF2066 domain-containing protein [Stenotrophobium sp.]